MKKPRDCVELLAAVVALLSRCLMRLEASWNMSVCATAATSMMQANNTKLFLEYAELANNHYGKRTKIGYNAKIFFLCF